MIRRIRKIESLEIGQTLHREIYYFCKNGEALYWYNSECCDVASFTTPLYVTRERYLTGFWGHRGKNGRACFRNTQRSKNITYCFYSFDTFTLFLHQLCCSKMSRLVITLCSSAASLHCRKAQSSHIMALHGRKARKSHVRSYIISSGLIIGIFSKVCSM